MRKGIRYSLLILLADALIIGLDSLVAGRNLFSYFTLLTLIEAAALLFVGGFKKPWILPVRALEPDKQRDKSLIVAGLILLASSFLLAYPLG